MTSVATIMGAAPIAFGLGAGSISRRPLGYAIIGGMILSTALTLYVVPVAYALFDQLRAREARDLKELTRGVTPEPAEGAR
jgi:multidrug efflux pump subunit AcrB